MSWPILSDEQVDKIIYSDKRLNERLFIGCALIYPKQAFDLARSHKLTEADFHGDRKILFKAIRDARIEKGEPKLEPILKLSSKIVRREGTKIPQNLSLMASAMVGYGDEVFKIWEDCLPVPPLVGQPIALDNNITVESVLEAERIKSKNY